MRFISLCMLFIFGLEAKVAAYEGFGGFGSREQAMAWAVKRSEVCSVALYQPNPGPPGNGFHTIGRVADKIPHGSMEEIQNSLQGFLAEISPKIFTDPKVRRDEDIFIFAYTIGMKYPGVYSIDYLELSTSFKLQNTSAGFKLPDLSIHKLDFTPVAVYRIPDLTWIRVVYDTGEFIGEADSRDADSDGIAVDYQGTDGMVKIDILNQTLILDSRLVMSGNVRISMTTESDKDGFKFECFDGLGKPTPETPFAIKLDPYTQSMVVEGGEPGRVLTLDRTVDLGKPFETIDSALEFVVPTYGTLMIPNEKSKDKVSTDQRSSISGATRKAIDKLTPLIVPEGFYALRAVNSTPYQK